MKVCTDVCRFTPQLSRTSDYPFVKYNVQATVHEYSFEEYVNLLAGEQCNFKQTSYAYKSYHQDDAWSKEETDRLFQLVKEYDGRFYIIADRYDFPGRPRSMEVRLSNYLFNVLLNLGNTRI